MKTRNYSRREFAAAMAAPALAQAARQGGAEDLAKGASEQARANAAALDKVSLPMTTEPSFVFRTL